MEELFVPYEEALALKELGFDELCLGFYLNGNNIVAIGTDRVFTSEDMPILKAPLYQQAFDWFREKHGLFGWLNPLVNGRTGWVIEYLPNYNELRDGIPDGSEENYDDARLICLKQLIEMVKK